MTSVSIAGRTSWFALTAALVAVLVLQVWAGLTLRGLYADGAYYALELLLHHDFAVLEPSRWTSQMLMQAPVVLAMAFGLDAPRAVAASFSLATNLLPLLLTLCCCAVLPPRERAFGLFPIFVFLAAAMSAAFASVADGPTAAAYSWLLLLLILFGRLSRWRLMAILVLAAGAIRLHEATAFLGPILVFACLWRCRARESRAARLILLLAALMVAVGCGIAVHDVLHPRVTANRSSFVNDVVSFHWLAFGPRDVNVMALAGLLATLSLPIAWLRGRALMIAVGALGLVFIALAALALIQPAWPPAAFAARNNACLLSFPAMISLLVLRNRRPPPPGMALVAAMLGAVIALADGSATAGWLGYTAAMRAALVSEQGVVPWRQALARLPAAQAETLARLSWPWTTPLMSLWLAPGPVVDAVIANPEPVVWQPFDPEKLRGALAAGGTPPTRSGFVALLGR
jgi:hypothetical protein